MSALEEYRTALEYAEGHNVFLTSGAVEILADAAIAELERMLLLMTGEYRRVAEIDLIISDEMVLDDLRARAEKGRETP